MTSKYLLYGPRFFKYGNDLKDLIIAFHVGLMRVIIELRLLLLLLRITEHINYLNRSL